jgi:hypothetical protein
MSIPFLPIHTLSQRLMSKSNRRQIRHQQAGATASKGGPVFVSPEDQFRMSLDTRAWFSTCWRVIDAWSRRQMITSATVLG